jgi:hypothetical protein
MKGCTWSAKMYCCGSEAGCPEIGCLCGSCCYHAQRLSCYTRYVSFIPHADVLLSRDGPQSVPVERKWKSPEAKLSTVCRWVK